MPFVSKHFTEQAIFRDEEMAGEPPSRWTIVAGPFCIPADNGLIRSAVLDLSRDAILYRIVSTNAFGTVVNLMRVSAKKTKQ